MTRKRVKEDRSFASRFQFKMEPSRQREIAGLALFAFGGLALLSLLHITPGVVSERAAQMLRALFGWGAFGLPVAAFVGSAFLLRRGEPMQVRVVWGRILAGEILCAAALALMHLASRSPNAAVLADSGGGGGFIGYAISNALSSAIGGAGAGIVLVLVGLFSLPAIAGLNIDRLQGWSARETALEPVTRKPRARGAPVPDEPDEEPVVEEPSDGLEPEPEEEPIAETPVRPEFGKTIPAAAPAAPPPPPPITHPVLTERTRGRKRGILPSLDLMAASNEAKYGETDANRKARVIEETLANFGIPVKVIEVNAGPTITQFGLEPGFVTRRTSDGQTRQRKVSVGRIAALQHDLELALAAAPIRIETPVPGRPIVGIEVPNQSVSLVSLRGVLETDAVKKKKGPLKIALGRDVSGTAISADLSVMPHLLIAGATGSGKSVCINAIIACLLFDNSPDDLRLIMVDPKRVELTSFNNIPHLLGPVIVNVDEVVAALRWVVDEMDARFTIFAKTGVRNIDAYNDKIAKGEGEPSMPYIVVLIDELADLMLAAPDDTEKLLTRLAQMARATGIHLVLATQRPSVDVVTGLIKANFPARISFAVTSSVDSRVVLDSPGAEKLLGKGDMLYMSSDSSKLLRLQGAFVSDEELARLVHYWREKAMGGAWDIVHEPPWRETGLPGRNGGDDLINKATALVRQSDHTSISFLQRKLGIGYPRAARLMDQLEALGVVGPDEGGGKPRVVIPPPPPPADLGRSKKKK